MTILAILQNQWFRDPERVRKMIAEGEARHPGKYRHRLIATALFAGCRTGANLRKTFGEWCDRIVWEESSPDIGGHAASVFPADPEHLQKLLTEIKPDVVLTFGLVATTAMTPLLIGTPVHHITAPHPTARAGDTLRLLWNARRNLELHAELHARP